MSRTNEEKILLNLSEAITTARGLLLDDHDYYNNLTLQYRAAHTQDPKGVRTKELETKMGVYETYLLDMNQYLRSLEAAKTQITFLANTSNDLNPISVAKRVRGVPEVEAPPLVMLNPAVDSADAWTGPITRAKHLAWIALALSIAAFAMRFF